jgi:citrate synthase
VARVAVGCRANLYAAVTAATATFSGALHGGAAEKVVDLIKAVQIPENAAAYVRGCLERNEAIMGFGHRIYRTEDPRVRHLRKAAEQLAHKSGDLRGISVLEAVCEVMKPYCRHGISPNVDLYSGVVYGLLGLPSDLASAIFVAGRIAGWVAQILEQQRNNILIRPLLRYVGPASRPYEPVHARSGGVRSRTP